MSCKLTQTYPIRAHLSILYLQRAAPSINVGTIQLLFSSSSRSIGFKPSIGSLRIYTAEYTSRITVDSI